MYSLLISAHSLISANIHVHFTTLSNDNPFLSRTDLIFSIVCLVSGFIPPATSFVSPGISVYTSPIWPDKKNRFPTLTASEKGIFVCLKVSDCKYSTF